jgi:hypothetical protein
MKSLSLTQVITVGSFVMLAAAGAKAESYDGVQSAVSAKSRAEVGAEAVRTASAPNQNIVRGSRGAETMAALDRPLARRGRSRAHRRCAGPERVLGLAREQQGHLDHAEPRRCTRRSRAQQQQQALSNKATRLALLPRPSQ